MSLVPDITVDVGDSTRQEARRRRLCEPVAVGRSAGEGVLSVDGHLSECPAIWESTDPRSTLRRQAGGPVEILVRTATLATFRNAGLSAPNASDLHPGAVGEPLAARQELFLSNSPSRIAGWKGCYRQESGAGRRGPRYTAM